MRPLILIVEDHEALRNLLREWLSISFPDCVFLEAQSGEEALALASAQPPEVVLMDLGLPGMNGIETTRRLKAMMPQAQVVMLTVHEASDYRAAARAAGASGYVPKRTVHTELAPLLASLLPRPVETPENQAAGM